MKTQNILKYLVIGGMFLVPFIAFIVPGNMYFPFISGKGFVFRILVEILFGLYVMLAFWSPEYRPKMSWLTKAVSLFVLVIFIADVFSVNAYKSLWSNYERMEGFVLIIHLFAYYIVASSVLRKVSDWKNWFNMSLGASALMCVYGALQLSGNLVISQGGVRLDGTFGNASYFAIYLVFHIFLALYLLVKNYRSVSSRWIYGVVAVGEICVLYFTATRGAILGLIGGLLFSTFVVAWKEKENKKIKKIAVGALMGVIIFVAGFVAIRNTSFVRTSPVMSRFASLSMSEVKTQGRYFVWPMALKGVVERPILGWGQESFNFVFNKNYDPRMYGQEQWFDRTHNVILDWLIAGGILGLLSYMSMFFALFYYIWKKKSDLSVTEKSLFTGMILAYVFHNMFVFDNLISYIMFFSILAYVHARSVEDKEEHSKFYKKVFSKDSLYYAVTPTVIVFAVCAVYFVNVPAIQANTLLISSISSRTNDATDNLKSFEKVFSYNSFGNDEALEQIIMFSSHVYSSSLPDTLKQQAYDLTKQKIEEKIARTPNDARYLVFAGNFFNRFAKYDEAVIYLNRAIEQSPKKQPIYFELGTSYIGKGDYVKAFELFKKAYDLEPNSPESRMIYTVGAIYTKNVEVMKVMLPQIDKNVFVSDNRILQAYATIGDNQSVVTILNERLKGDPTNLQYKFSLASAYYQMGQKQKAIDLIREMIKQEPKFKDEGEKYIQQIQKEM